MVNPNLDFNKLSTPIKSVAAYPDVPSQCARFADRGWSKVHAQSLWSAWNDDRFLSANDRRKLDEVEPFDEWEEFCLFASHYLILHAANYGGKGLWPCSADSSPETLSIEATTSYKPLAGHHGLRRFGAAMIASDTLGRTSILNCMGLGPTTRLPSYDIYKHDGSGGDIKFKPTGPSGRMCHSMTDLGARGTLCVGGRNSPSRAKSDCWLLNKSSHQWERTRDLPVPLYRHAVCRLSGSAVALLIGGKSGAGTVSSAVMIFDPDKGWTTCEVRGSLTPRPVFGAMLTCSGSQREGAPTFHGFLIGGASDGVIQSQVLAWDLVLGDREVGRPFHESISTSLTGQTPSITFKPAETDEASSALLSRFGATCIQQEDCLVVLGGVGHDGVIPQTQEILLCSTVGSKIQVVGSIPLLDATEGQVIPRPLIVGSSVVSPQDGQIVILGGGATCFSMGSFCM